LGGELTRKNASRRSGEKDARRGSREISPQPPVKRRTKRKGEARRRYRRHSPTSERGKMSAATIT